MMYMVKSKYILILTVFFVACVGKGFSQELNARLTINTTKVQGVDKDIFKAMESSLQQMLNERQWSSYAFSQNEKIDCTFVLTITDAGADDSYVADLQVTSRRPVYNSSYISPLFNFRDADVYFNYVKSEPLEFTENSISNNLVAIFGFYANVIIGLDFDSFSMNGGKPFFERALSIANAGQMLNPKGWTPFESNRNRYALALSLTEESSTDFHNMWYTYHRLGLDEMANNMVRGRDKVVESLNDLQKVYSARPNSALILFYGDTKLTEVINIVSEASTSIKKDVYDKLKRIYPTKASQLDSLKK